eukprot:483983-Hanusia_phi.AAC.1
MASKPPRDTRYRDPPPSQPWSTFCGTPVSPHPHIPTGTGGMGGGDRVQGEGEEKKCFCCPCYCYHAAPSTAFPSPG